MARHGRQQLLACQSLRKGQALVELLAAVMLFFAIIFVSYTYFQVMRMATVRQEVVRNLAFATINYAGSLTTPPNFLDDPTDRDSVQIDPRSTVEFPNRAFIPAAASCWRVFPPSRVLLTGTELPSFILRGSRTPIFNSQTHAAVHRLGSGGDACSMQALPPLTP